MNPATHEKELPRQTIIWVRTQKNFEAEMSSDDSLKEMVVSMQLWCKIAEQSDKIQNYGHS
jgi:hypothetical protein